MGIDAAQVAFAHPESTTVLAEDSPACGGRTVLCDRSRSADKRGMPLFTVYERASERLVVAWTYSRARVVLMVVTEDGRTRWRTFPDPAAFRTYWSGVENALQNAGWVRRRRQPETELSPPPAKVNADAPASPVAP